MLGKLGPTLKFAGRQIKGGAQNICQNASVSQSATHCQSYRKIAYVLWNLFQNIQPCQQFKFEVTLATYQLFLIVKKLCALKEFY